MPMSVANTTRGFLELGAPLKAWEMLEDLPPEQRTHPDVFSCRLAILTVLERWELGLELPRLLESAPEAQPRRDCAGFCHAYATALCTMGRVEEAKEHIARASRLWPAQRLALLDEPALRDVWEAGWMHCGGELAIIFAADSSQPGAGTTL
jgi:hypothetical protein